MYFALGPIDTANPRRPMKVGTVAVVMRPVGLEPAGRARRGISPDLLAGMLGAHLVVIGATCYVGRLSSFDSRLLATSTARDASVRKTVMLE
jgi:hypothetical protein